MKYLPSPLVIAAEQSMSTGEIATLANAALAHVATMYGIGVSRRAAESNSSPRTPGQRHVALTVS